MAALANHRTDVAELEDMVEGAGGTGLTHGPGPDPDQGHAQGGGGHDLAAIHLASSTPDPAAILEADQEVAAAAGHRRIPPWIHTASHRSLCSATSMDRTDAVTP